MRGERNLEMEIQQGIKEMKKEIEEMKKN